MAEKHEVTGILRGFQDTGNPVLDTMVNIVAIMPHRYGDAKTFRDLHALLLELAEKEPGGLKTRGGASRRARRK